MDSLAGPVKTPTMFLLGAGIIMVITLFTSRKARSVTQTEVSLARQDVGDERWSSTPFSRSVVHGVLGFSKVFNKIIPENVHTFVERRFSSGKIKQGSKNPRDNSSFDLLRASVNTIVASILIASGTSLKLPLSTTYVTFMVAMGTSLADRAWGRESAVYRVSGVLTVIGGWFFTAIIAFTAAFIIANFLNWGGVAAILISLTAALFFVIKTNFIHKSQVEKQIKKDEFDQQLTLTGENILQRCNLYIISVTESVSRLYSSSIVSLNRENRKRMKKVIKEVKELNQFTKQLKYNLFPTLKKLEKEYIETGQYYVQILDYLREVAHCLEFIAVPIYEHLDNNHPSLLPEQIKEMEHLNEMIKSYFEEIVRIMKKKTYKDLNKLIAQQHDILDQISKMKKKQIRLVRSEAVGTRNTMLYLNLLSESKNLVLHTLNVTKAHRDFSLSDELKSGSNKIIPEHCICQKLKL